MLLALVCVVALGSELTFVTRSGIVAQPATANKPLIIDGAKNPELIPDWYRWERLFNRAGEAARLPDPGSSPLMPNVLGLSDGDLAVLRKESELHSVRRRSHEARVRTVGEGFDRNGIKPEDLMEKLYSRLFDVELEYRREILAARFRALQ